MPRNNRSTNSKRSTSRRSRSTEEYEDKQYFEVAEIEYANDKQKQVHKLIQTYTGTFIEGPAGTGKSHTATYEMLKGIANGTYSKSIITRPTVVAGEKMGYLPGNATEKTDPYLRPIYDMMNEMLGHKLADELKNKNIVETYPIQFMRGTTFHNAFILIDEAQNCTREELILALTRVGRNSKVVVTFDPSQTDLKLRDGSPNLSGVELLRLFSNKPNFGYFTFTHEDIMRSPFVKQFLEVVNNS